MRGLLVALVLLTGAPVLAEEPAMEPELILLDRQLQVLGELLDDGMGRDPEALEREPMRSAVERYDDGVRVLVGRGAPAELLRSRRATLVAARMFQVNAALSAGDAARALTRADVLLARLGQIRATTGPDVEMDRVREGLIRMAVTTSDVERARRWAATCSEDCATEPTRSFARAVWQGEGVDPLSGEIVEGPSSAAGPAAEPGVPPRLLRWRIGLHWTLPTPGLSSEGANVAKSPVDGGAVFAVAPTPAGCVDVAVGWDRWNVAEDGFSRRRTRLEAGWCPTVLMAQRGRTVIALRASIGAGLALGRTVYEGAQDQRDVRIGPHVRAEIPIRFGAVELGPRVSWVPYGGGGNGVGRAALFGLAVAVGAKPRELDQR